MAQKLPTLTMAATRHDGRNRRPVRDALLKWQLKQDQRRVAETKRRLMRMAAPSPSSSLGLESSYDRRPTVRRPRPVRHHDAEEDALMTLITEREEREAATSKHHNERFIRPPKPSKLQYPSALLSLRRHEGPKPPVDNSVKGITLRPTGQKLNGAGDFYSPVRPLEVALNSSSSEFRQNLAFSRIKAPAPKRLVGTTATPSPRNPQTYDQMKTPDRWRTTAMRSNQEELNESALRRWEEEDARQADRLLEKAARDGDHEALWNDLFYGTKSARAKTNQLPEQPVVYSTSSFPEVYSRSRPSNSRGSSCFKAEDDRSKSPHIADGGMLPSDLSAKCISKHIRPSSTMQDSEVRSRAADSTAPTSTQTISEMLASMEKSSELEPVDADLVARDDQNHAGSSDGADRGEFPRSEVSVQVGASSGMEIPRWSVLVVTSCLVVGTSGFFMEELMTLMFFFSRRTLVTLSQVEQERMRDRVNALQQDLQSFQLSTSEIGVKSQTVLTELQQHMDRMRLNREKHQDMLANEMQELRRHILHVTHELVEKERESMQAQLEELMTIQVVKVEKVGPRDAIAVFDVKSDENPEDTASEASILVESNTGSTMSKPVLESISDSSAEDEIDRKTDDNQVYHGQKQIVAPIQLKDDSAIAFLQASSQLDKNRAQTEQSLAQIKQDVTVSSSPEIFVDIQDINFKSVPQVHVEEIKIEHVQEVVAVPASNLEQGGNSKIHVSVAPAPQVKTVVKPRNASEMSWEGIFLLVGVMFLVACVVLRVYNINRRKRWFEERRKRRTQRALRLAQQRARTMAEHRDDSDEWDGDETDGDVEEVSLMTPVRDSEDDEAGLEQSPEADTDIGENNNQKDQASYSPGETYHLTTIDQRARTRTRLKSSYSRRSPLLLRPRSPQSRRQHQMPEY